MMSSGDIDATAAFEDALAAAVNGETVTDTGLDEPVIDALDALADLWPLATPADTTAARAVFEASQQ